MENTINTQKQQIINPMVPPNTEQIQFLYHKLHATSKVPNKVGEKEQTTDYHEISRNRSCTDIQGIKNQIHLNDSASDTTALISCVDLLPHENEGSVSTNSGNIPKSLKRSQNVNSAAKSAPQEREKAEAFTITKNIAENELVNDEGFHEQYNNEDEDEDVFFSLPNASKINTESTITDYCKEPEVSDLIDWLDKDDGHKKILMSFCETLNLTHVDSPCEKFTTILADECKFSWQEIDTLKRLMRLKLFSDKIDTVDKTKKILMKLYLTEVEKQYKTVPELIEAFKKHRFLSAATFLEEDLPKALESIQKIKPASPVFPLTENLF